MKIAITRTILLAIAVLNFFLFIFADTQWYNTEYGSSAEAFYETMMSFSAFMMILALMTIAIITLVLDIKTLKEPNKERKEVNANANRTG